MFSKTWMMGIISSMVLQNAPQLEGFATMGTSLIVAALLTWARNDAVKTKTKANPLLGYKKKS